MTDKDLDFEFEPEDIFEETTAADDLPEEAPAAADSGRPVKDNTETEPVAEASAEEGAVTEDTIAEETVAEETVSSDPAEEGSADEDSFDIFSDDEFLTDDDLFAETKERSGGAKQAAAPAGHGASGENTGSSLAESEEDKEKKGPSVLGKIFSILIPAILVAVILLSGGLFLRDLLEYRAADKVYDKLDEFVKEAPENSFVPDEEEPEVEITGAVPDATVHAVYPRLDIDYDALKEVNGDFVGVLYVPALDLRYPVAKSRNNDEYLTRTFEGTRNSAGSIFLDMNASINLSDSNSIIFGHNMKNGSMFGSLQKFLQDDTLADSDPYFYIYQDGRVLKYRIFSYYTTLVDSYVYYGFQDAAGYGRYVAKAISSSAYHPAETFDFMGYPPMVVLSTCYGSGHVYNFVVHGVLQETIIRNRK
ncbi:MAG: sortase [Lachnospiraceae bacterium]|nr:sortase [Lachnospiraceae bacterium]